MVPHGVVDMIYVRAVEILVAVCTVTLVITIVVARVAMAVQHVVMISVAHIVQAWLIWKCIIKLQRLNTQVALKLIVSALLAKCREAITAQVIRAIAVSQKVPIAVVIISPIVVQADVLVVVTANVPIAASLITTEKLAVRVAKFTLVPKNVSPMEHGTQARLAAMAV